MLSQHASPRAERMKPVPGFEEIACSWDATLNAWCAKILPGEFYITRADEAITRIVKDALDCVRFSIWADTFLLTATVLDDAVTNLLQPWRRALAAHRRHLRRAVGQHGRCRDRRGACRAPAWRRRVVRPQLSRQPVAEPPRP